MHCRSNRVYLLFNFLEWCAKSFTNAMSSSVHFRFKSTRQFESLSFEGDFLKVADLKVAIVDRKKLNFGEGFDLEISDASTGDGKFSLPPFPSRLALSCYFHIPLRFFASSNSLFHVLCMLLPRQMQSMFSLS